MTPLELLLDAAERATPGPWFQGSWNGYCRKPEHYLNHPGPRGDNPCIYEYEITGGEYFGKYVSAGTKENHISVIDTSYDELSVRLEDAAFIAAARNAIPALQLLLERLREAEKVIDNLNVPSIAAEKYRQRFPKAP